MPGNSAGTAYLTLVPALKKGWKSGVNSELKGGLDGKSAGQSAGGGFMAGFGGMLKGLAGLAVVKQAASAVADVFKQSFSNYADYEQLVGGVETLFGAGGKSAEEYAASVGKSVSEISGQYSSLMAAQDTVMANAAQAYATAGLSANEYMDTVTSFSASLISSLGGNTEEAAKLADVAIVDMADNANKIGTDMESIQNAYQGFAKQNYTMLDNLKLGYGGTKSEMERLLADAEAISGVHYDIDSYADVVSAIHVIQDEMGIAGTTAEEARHTVSGSIGMVQSAWQNLLTGFGDADADIGALIGNLFDSLGAAASNIVPLIGRIGSSMMEALPMLLDQAMQLLTQLMDQFAAAAPSIAPMIADTLTSLIDVAVANLPELIEAALAIITGLVQGLVASMPVLIDAIPGLASSVVDAIVQCLPMIAAAAGTIFVGLCAALPGLFGSVLSTLGSLVAQIPSIIDGIWWSIYDAGANLIRGLWSGISSLGGWIWDQIKGFCSGIPAAVREFFGIHSPSRVFAEIGGQLMEGMAVGIDSGAAAAERAITRANAAVLGLAGGAASYDLAIAGAGAGGSGNTYIINGIDFADNARIYAAFEQIVGELQRLGRL